MPNIQSTMDIMKWAISYEAPVLSPIKRVRSSGEVESISMKLKIQHNV